VSFGTLWTSHVAYFVVGLAVYVRSDLALVNPTLYLLGGQIVRVQHGGRRVLMVCHQLPNDGNDVRAGDFLDVIVVEEPPR
jgi:hypothetical protein